MDSHHVLQVLNGLMSSTGVTDAEKTLRSMFECNEFAQYVFPIILNASLQVPLRQQACLSLKSFIKFRWEAFDDFQELPEQNKAQIRIALLEPEIIALQEDKLRVAISMCIAEIVQIDFPYEWGDFFDTLMKRLVNNSDNMNMVQGCIGALSISAEVADNQGLVNVVERLYPTLIQVFKNDQCPMALRIDAIIAIDFMVGSLVSRECSDDELENFLRPYVAEIANVMNSNQNVDVDVLLLRTQLVGNLQTLIDHFPEFLDQIRDSFVPLCLAAISNLPIQHEIVRILVDKTIILLELIIDQMGGDLITDHLANIMSELAGFILLNESFEEDPEFYDNFLTETTLTLRLSILGFFSEVMEKSPDLCAGVLINLIAKLTKDGNILPIEASLRLSCFLARKMGDPHSNFQSPGFDANQFVQTLVIPAFQSESIELKIRCLCTAPYFFPLVRADSRNSIVQLLVSSANSNVAAERVAAIYGFSNLLGRGYDGTHVEVIFESLIQVLPTLDGNSLITFIELVPTLIEFKPKCGMNTYESLIKVVLEKWNENASNPDINKAMTQALKSYSSFPDLLPCLRRLISPILVNIFSNSEQEPHILVSGFALLGVVLGKSEDVPRELFTTFLPTVCDLISKTSDEEVINAGFDFLLELLVLCKGKLATIKLQEGTTVFELYMRLLSSCFDDERPTPVGTFIFNIFNYLGDALTEQQSLQIVLKAAEKLVSCKILNVKCEILTLFARLINSQGLKFLDFLSQQNIQMEGGKINLLEATVRIWLREQKDMITSEQLQITTQALCLLLESKDKRLTFNVQGYAQSTSKRRTRSMSKKLSFTQVPVPVRIVSLLCEMYQDQLLLSIDDDVDSTFRDFLQTYLTTVSTRDRDYLVALSQQLSDQDSLTLKRIITRQSSAI